MMGYVPLFRVLSMRVEYFDFSAFLISVSELSVDEAFFVFSREATREGLCKILFTSCVLTEPQIFSSSNFSRSRPRADYTEAMFFMCALNEVLRVLLHRYGTVNRKLNYVPINDGKIGNKIINTA